MLAGAACFSAASIFFFVRRRVCSPLHLRCRVMSVTIRQFPDNEHFVSNEDNGSNPHPPVVHPPHLPILVSHGVMHPLVIDLLGVCGSCGGWSAGDQHATLRQKLACRHPARAASARHASPPSTDWFQSPGHDRQLALLAARVISPSDTYLPCTGGKRERGGLPRPPNALVWWRPWILLSSQVSSNLFFSHSFHSLTY